MSGRESHTHVALVDVCCTCLPQSHNLLELSNCHPCLPPSVTAEHFELGTRFYVRGVGENWRIVEPASVGSFMVDFTVGRESRCMCLHSGWELAHASQHLPRSC